jgi:histidine triad (HIT) family protein
MDDCIFCKIIRGQIPSYKVYEDDNYLAFLDISQFTRGHTLVVPKKHYAFIWDIEDIGSFMEVVKKIGNHYRKLGFKYVDTLTFGRLVSHAHLHIVPHNGNDPDWEKGLAGLEYFHSAEHPQKSAAEFTKLVEDFKLS